MLHDAAQIALQRAMEGASLRQEALAANLANANTPGYQRRDVDFKGALQSAIGASDPAAALERARFSATQDPAAVVRADGSTVDVDAESAKLAANGLEYEQLAGAARVRIEILKIAMGVA
jgi:flagellar basal-body rod protein FlgB